jgi:competence protein ComEA
MFQGLKDYFSFNRRERNGVIILVSIIAFLVILPFVLPFFINPPKTDFTKFKKDIDAFEKTLIASEGNSDRQQYKEFDYSSPDKSIAESKLTPFPFDPNNLPEEQWKAIGLSDKQIKSIKNYEAKGGKFYKKEDFKKMYCITATEYSILEPFITIKEIAKPSFKSDFKKSEKNSKIIELNSADTTELQTLKGIGKYFALKIISYRRLLGGFSNIAQLLEVKGMDTARYELIKNYVSINPAYLHKQNVNSATFDELKKHPYIGYNIALSLINYRQVHGNFKALAEIKNSALITEKVYAKISPYLKVE